MNRPRGGWRVLIFTAAATLLTALTLALIGIGAMFLSTPPVKAQLASWSEGLFPGFQPPPHLVNPARAADPAPFIPVTGGEAPAPAAVQGSAATPTPAPTGAAPAVAPEHPVEPPPAPQGRLVIPALDLDTTLQHVPVTDGDWIISDLTDRVGWLETTGTEPLDRYAMVFAGHVTLPEPAGPGPFYRLRDLRPGDEIIYRLGEKEYVYQVDAREIVPPDSVGRLYIEDGERIVLVTCTDWNYLSQQYDYRLVVQASLVRTVKAAGPPE